MQNVILILKVKLLFEVKIRCVKVGVFSKKVILTKCGFACVPFCQIKTVFEIFDVDALQFCKCIAQSL